MMIIPILVDSAFELRTQENFMFICSCHEVAFKIIKKKLSKLALTSKIQLK